MLETIMWGLFSGTGWHTQHQDPPLLLVFPPVAPQEWSWEHLFTCNLADDSVNLSANALACTHGCGHSVPLWLKSEAWHSFHGLFLHLPVVDSFRDHCGMANAWCHYWGWEESKLAEPRGHGPKHSLLGHRLPPCSYSLRCSCLACFMESKAF